jgi:hypothetical protein
VHDLGGVRHGERFGHLPRDAEGPLERHALAGDLPQRRPFDELHRDVAVVVHNAGFVNGDDVGVIERRGEGRFAQQPIDRVAVAPFACAVEHQRPANHLQRDVATEAWIVRAIHFAHAPRAKLAEDVIRTDTCTRGKRHGKRGLYQRNRTVPTMG